MRNTFWLIAGVNGSGKSTLVEMLRSTSALQHALYFNPDRVTQWILSRQPRLGLRKANIQAADMTLAAIELAIGTTDHDVAAETVLSTDKYRQVVRDAKASGRRFGLVYIGLRDAKQSIQRVKLRVRRGGHDVPINKLRKRWHGSLAQLPWFICEADTCVIYSNRGARPLPVGFKYYAGRKPRFSWEDRDELPHITAIVDKIIR